MNKLLTKKGLTGVNLEGRFSIFVPKGIPPDYGKCDHQLKGKVCSKSFLGGLIMHIL